VAELRFSISIHMSYLDNAPGGPLLDNADWLQPLAEIREGAMFEGASSSDR
jgi:hypothetical protein